METTKKPQRFGKKMTELAKSVQLTPEQNKRFDGYMKNLVKGLNRAVLESNE